MHVKSRPRVRYDRPPVVEVVFGVAFTGLQAPMKSAHVGLYWSGIKTSFPRTEDAQPLVLTMENPVGDPTQHMLQVEFVAEAPMRRAWFLNDAGTNLVQVQENRFLFNWKQTEQVPAYPGFDVIAGQFARLWDGFREFLQEQKLGVPKIQQLELTYINQIPDDGNEYFVDHQRIREAGRFLPTPEAINWRSQYLLPEMAGRLHVSAVTARKKSSGDRIIRLDMVARGMPKEGGDDAIKSWFDVAHEWITQGFTDLTSEDAHKMWGRTA